MAYKRKTSEELLGEAWKPATITCLCPRCGKYHQAYLGKDNQFIKWSGRGIPRKFCQGCKKIIENYSQRYLRDYEDEREAKKQKSSKRKLILFTEPKIRIFS